MQKLFNNPANVVDEMLEAYVKVHSDLVVQTENERVIKYKFAPIKGKVGIVTGGGSGHKPAFIGYVGRNMVDAVACGEIFSSPKGNEAKRRGVAGEIMMWKVGGAKAGMGASLDEVIGDGDHGVNMNKGFTMCRQALDSNPGDLSHSMLAPAVEAFDKATKCGKSFSDGLDDLIQAAIEGRDSTKEMVAQLGRASRLGERSRGVLDAGATSCCLILETMATTTKLLLK